MIFRNCIALTIFTLGGSIAIAHENTEAWFKSKTELVARCEAAKELNVFVSEEEAENIDCNFLYDASVPFGNKGDKKGRKKDRDEERYSR